MPKHSRMTVLNTLIQSGLVPLFFHKDPEVAGQIVQASLWDASLGGHHVGGKLSFPGSAETGSVLEGAKKITLTLLNVDTPERVFVWERGG